MHALCACYLLFPLITLSSLIYTEEKWRNQPHPKVISLSLGESGRITGVTEGGYKFTQEQILDLDDLRVDRFVMGEHVHYIANGEYIPDEVSLEELLHSFISA